MTYVQARSTIDGTPSLVDGRGTDPLHGDSSVRLATIMRAFCMGNLFGLKGSDGGGRAPEFMQEGVG